MWKSKRLRAKEFLAKGLAGPPATEQLKFTLAEAKRLMLELQGSVVLWNDPNYDRARQASDAAYQEFPQIIVYCEVFNDVRASLAFAKRHGLWPVCRSGGHSTAGYSINSEMVIDLSRICYTVVDPAARRAVVGAGTNFGHVNSTLDTFRLHVPGGGCEDVCVAGYSQGGGFGFTSRKFGMNCDNVVEALVMLADGRIVVANDKRNHDLFWALRGGTGNNFGVLLQLTYQLYELDKLWGFGIQWPIADAPKALSVLQGSYMRTCAIDEIGYMGFIAYEKGEPILAVRGMYVGSAEAGRAALKPLLETPGALLNFDHVGTYFELNRSVLSETEFPPVPDLSREGKDCAYIDRALSESDWSEIVTVFEDAPNPGSMITLEPYGGAIKARKPTDMAFVHRDAYLDLALDVFFLNAVEQAAATKYLDEFFQRIEPYTSGFKYQNYPRVGNENFRWNYWGDNFSTLLAIKQKYDPGDFFRYEQSVTPIPATAGPSVRRPSSELVIAIPPSIDYERY